MMALDRARQDIEDHIEELLSGDARALESLSPAIHAAVHALDEGLVRVASPTPQGWQTESWLKHAILAYFRLMPMTTVELGPFVYHDKIPLKKNYAALKVRVVPPACARYGSFMEPGVILMPSYVNIGAYVGEKSMVDTWATVGSCAQIGANVHLSGGVGVGGVLEPPHASPVIIEDGAFIGSRCILVEGVQVGKEAVLAANTTITASTPIFDARNAELKEIRGKIPARAVVVPGTRDKIIGDAKIQLNCAYIIGERKVSTDLKTSLNQVLRDFAVSL